MDPVTAVGTAETVATGLQLLAKLADKLGGDGLLVVLLAPSGILAVLCMAILIMWWLDGRAHQAQLKAYREDTKLVLDNGDKKHGEVLQMYNNNVLLVETTQDVARDFKQVTVDNQKIMMQVAQALTRICDMTGAKGLS